MGRCPSSILQCTHPSTHLATHPLPIHPPIIHPSFHPHSIYPPFFHLSIHLSISPSTHLFFYPSIYIFIHPFTNPPSINLFIVLPIYPLFHPPIHSYIHCHCHPSIHSCPHSSTQFSFYLLASPPSTSLISPHSHFLTLSFIHMLHFKTANKTQSLSSESLCLSNNHSQPTGLLLCQCLPDPAAPPSGLGSLHSQNSQPPGRLSS